MADDRTLSLVLTLKAPPERVFDAWTEPSMLVKWWGPEGTDTKEYQMDVRVGGAWRTVFDGAYGRRIVSGVYRVIERPRRLAMTWGWEQPDGSRGHETIVDVRFEPVAAGTRLSLEQKRFINAEQRDLHSQGWSSSFRKLERLFG